MTLIFKVQQNLYTQVNGNRHWVLSLPFQGLSPCGCPLSVLHHWPFPLYCILPLSTQTWLLPYNSVTWSPHLPSLSFIFCSSMLQNSCKKQSILTVIPQSPHSPLNPFLSSFCLQLSPQLLLSRAVMPSMRSKPVVSWQSSSWLISRGVPASCLLLGLGDISLRFVLTYRGSFSFSFASPNPNPNP